jgi:hypothetical protein
MSSPDHIEQKGEIVLPLERIDQLIEPSSIRPLRFGRRSLLIGLAFLSLTILFARASNALCHPETCSP